MAHGVAALASRLARGKPACCLFYELSTSMAFIYFSPLEFSRMLASAIG